MLTQCLSDVFLSQVVLSKTHKMAHNSIHCHCIEHKGACSFVNERQDVGNACFRHACIAAAATTSNARNKYFSKSRRPSSSFFRRLLQYRIWMLKGKYRKSKQIRMEMHQFHRVIQIWTSIWALFHQHQQDLQQHRTNCIPLPLKISEISVFKSCSCCCWHGIGYEGLDRYCYNNCCCSCSSGTVGLFWHHR